MTGILTFTFTSDKNSGLEILGSPQETQLGGSIKTLELSLPVSEPIRET
jgi:hypothetical protein